MARTYALIGFLAFTLVTAGEIQAQQAGAARSSGGAAGGAANSAGIYSCVDSRGHTITADRPLPDCINRQHSKPNANGKTAGHVETHFNPRPHAYQAVR